MKTNIPITEKPAIAVSGGYVQPFIDFRHGDGVAGMATIKSGTVKCVLVDPPYLYLKGQKLEREFDELLYFSKVRRVLRDDGFIVMFGRGKSFYRWNGLLEMLGFKFKEEMIWNKNQISSPVTEISRVHETISIWTKKSGKLNLVFTPYLKDDPPLDKIHQDLKRIKSGLNNPNELKMLEQYVTDKSRDYVLRRDDVGSKATVQTSIRASSRAVTTLEAIDRGHKIKSIYSCGRDHYDIIHPTQKPVGILIDLLKLTTDKGDLVVDNFAGSASCGEASAELERPWIGWEIDKEYYDLAINKRLSKLSVQVSLF